MASHPLNPAYRTVEAQEFLGMDFGDAKAELVNGTIFMMSGGSRAHSSIATNIIIALGRKLSGSGCRPHGSDMAVQTGPASIRYPDVSVYCGEANRPELSEAKLIGDPKVIFEVLSRSTASNDQLIKLAEYRALPGVELIVFVDPDNLRVRNVGRDDEREPDWLATGSYLPLSPLGISLSHEEIFADL